MIFASIMDLLDSAQRQLYLKWSWMKGMLMSYPEMGQDFLENASILCGQLSG